MDIFISIIRLPIGLAYAFITLLLLLFETFWVWVFVVPISSLGSNRDEVKQQDDVKNYPKSIKAFPKILNWVFSNGKPPWE